MNYSRNLKKRRDDLIVKRLLVSWAICLTVGIIVGLGIGMLNFNNETREVQAMPIETIQPSETNFFTKEVQEPESIKSEPEYLGTWRITAYCPCEKCCGEWAKNRPGGIVVGAEGTELQESYSAAAPLPFGTKLYIDGLGEYVVQDRTASWVTEKYNNELVDIYFTDHEAAKQFGLQYHDVYIIESEVEKND